MDTLRLNRFTFFVLIWVLISFANLEADIGHDPFGGDSNIWNAKSSQSAPTQSAVWGSHRPGVYFGMKPQMQDAINFGISWYGITTVAKGGGAQEFRALRHQAEERDKTTYGWKSHNGRDFGVQEIFDPQNAMVMTTSWLSINGTWMAQVEAKSKPWAKKDHALSFIYYFNSESTNEEDFIIFEETDLLEEDGGIAEPEFYLNGYSATLAQEFDFLVQADPKNTAPSESTIYAKHMKDPAKTHVAGVRVDPSEVWKTSEVTSNLLMQDNVRIFTDLRKYFDGDQPPKLLPNWIFSAFPDVIQEDANLYLFQQYLNLPFSYFFIFGKSTDLEAPDDLIRTFPKEIKTRKVLFEDKFNQIFGLTKKTGLTDEHNEFGMSTLSNLIGGIGFWSGNGLHKSQSDSKKTVLGPDATLLSAVPSRSFFPRGFLWDEGFHQLVVSQWDRSLSQKILKSWLSLMDADGWIPREQILGEEARARVPSEFQAQDPSFANPPTLLFALEHMIDTKQSNDEDMEFFRSAFPLFQRNFNWFRRTQNGIEENSFRWRGRTENHTLCSGLDDYPRAQIPSEGEMHVDLISWMTLYARVLAKLAATLGEDDSQFLQYHSMWKEKILADYWSSESQAFCDIVKKQNFENRSFKIITSISRSDEAKQKLFNTTTQEKQHICHKGYISLFPLLLNLVDKEDPRLGEILSFIKNPQEIWSSYGLLSLSRSSPYFGSGENYWKGPIWMNVNYLVLASLQKNYVGQGIFQEKAKEVYSELRDNLISNLFQNYKKTGFLWEQYSPIDGKGQRSHPFTGWSSLILLIMAEIYP